MKKSLIALLAIGLLVGSIAAPAAAGKKKGRSAKAEYAAPAAFQWNPTGDANIGGVTFTTAANENFVSIKIKDLLGTPVSAAAGQDPDGDGSVDASFFCGSTDEPMPIEGGLEVTVFVFPGPCLEPLGPGFATQGTVTATFTK